jgi:hypothetical protein
MFFQIMQGEVETDLREKKAPQSWMSIFLEGRSKFDFKYELEGAYAVGMHGIAGALTIAAPMQTFCLAMCHYPQYLPMLQEEIDRVCGDRLPRSEDRPNLPFLRAVIRECFRWRPPVPTGIPHYLIQDDEYNGYHIPAGSTMHPLEWAISRDPTMYPDPEAFNPLRWLDSKYPTYREPLSQYPTILNCTQFGYGRRICQGQTVSDEDLLIGIGSIAWLFNLRPSNNDDTVPTTSPPRPTIATSISSEELNAGIANTNSAPTMEDIILSKYEYPGVVSKDNTRKEKDQLATANDQTATPPKVESNDGFKGSKHDPKTIDPTLDFTTLLIAKPLPFRFDLSIRDEKRAEKVRSLYQEGVEKGEFKPSREFWGEKQGHDKPLGWGKV